MLPDYESGVFKLGNFRLKVTIQFRSCQTGEIYIKQIQGLDLYICNECPPGQYSLAEPKKDDPSQICIICPSVGASYCQGNRIDLNNGFWRLN